jgi:hypothetical protein
MKRILQVLSVITITLFLSSSASAASVIINVDEYGRSLDPAHQPESESYNFPSTKTIGDYQCYSRVGKKWAKVVVEYEFRSACQILSKMTSKRWMGKRSRQCLKSRGRVQCTISLRGTLIRSKSNLIDSKQYDLETEHVKSRRAYLCGIYYINSMPFVYATPKIEWCRSKVIAMDAQELANNSCRSIGDLHVCGSSEWGVFGRYGTDALGPDVIGYHEDSGRYFTPSFSRELFGDV